MLAVPAVFLKNNDCNKVLCHKTHAVIILSFLDYACKISLTGNLMGFSVFR